MNVHVEEKLRVEGGHVEQVVEEGTQHCHPTNGHKRLTKILQLATSVYKDGNTLNYCFFVVLNGFLKQ